MSKDSTLDTPSSPSPKRLRSRLLTWFGRCLILVVGVLCLLLLGLQSHGVRQFLLAHLSNTITTRAGVHLEVEDFRLGITSSELEVAATTLRGDPDGVPFLVLDQVRVDWTWRGLISRRPRLESVEIVAPRLDLEAPFPESKAEPEPPPDAPESLDLGIDIAALRVLDGSVSQQWVTPRDWLQGWQLQDLEVHGTYLAGELQIESRGSRLQAQLAETARTTLTEHPVGRAVEASPVTLEVALHGRLPGTFTIDTLRATGEGLDLQADGRVDVRNEVLETAFELQAELPKLLPGVVDDAAPVRVSGTLDLKRLEGNLDIDMPRLPSRLLAPWIEPEIYQRWILADSFFTTRTALTLAGTRPEDVRGQAGVTWQRADATLVAVNLKVLEPQGDRLQIGFDGQLLNDLDGDISLQGRLSAADWGQLTALVVEEASGVVDLPQPIAWKQQVLDLWPSLPLPTPTANGSEAVLAQPLTLRWQGSGPLDDPELKLQLTGWRGALSLNASGRPVVQRGTVRLETRALDLAKVSALLGMTAEGRLDMDMNAAVGAKTWTLEGRGEGRQLALPDLGDADTLDWQADLRGTRTPSTGDAADAWHLAQGLLETSLQNFRWSIPPAVVATTDVATADAATTDDAAISAETVEAAEETAAEAVAQASVDGATDDGRNLPDTDPADATPAPSTGSVEALQLTLSMEQAAAAWQLDANTTSRGWILGAEAPAPITLSALDLQLDGRGRFSKSLNRLGLAALLATDDDSTAGQEALSMAGLGLETLSLEGTAGDLVFDPQQPPVEDLRIHLGAEGPRWTLHDMALAWGDIELTGGGDAHWQDELRAIRLQTQLQSQQARLSSLDADFEIDNGVMSLQVDKISSELGTGQLRATVPLANLARLPGLGEALEQLPLAVVGGPIQVSLTSPRIESAPWLELLQQPPSPWQLETGVEAELLIDLANPEQGSGTVTLEALQLHNLEQRIEGESPLQLDWSGEQIELQPSTLRVSGRSFQSTGSAQLAWQTTDSGVPLPEVTAWQGRLDGEAGLSFIQPYLPPEVRANGYIKMQARLSGSPAAPKLEATVEGPDARILMTAPYGVQISHPRADVRWVDDTIHVENITADVNGGQVLADGRLDGNGDFNAKGVLDTLRMRLDFGVIALLSGNFDLRWPAEGRPSLSSNILVERAVLRHPIDLDSLLLSSLLAPPEIVGLQGDAAEDDIALDLSIATIDGLRVRNNLADMRATWNPLRVRGTLQNPLIQGDIDAESGGLISVYGQTLRLDRAQITFPGVPGVAPVIDLATTSSLEDPSIVQNQEDLFANNTASSSESVERRLASGLATYYGNLLAGRLGRGLGSRTRLSIQPVLIFGESDPEARLALTRDLSANLALVAAVSLQDTQRRTYVLDVHDLAPWPAFVGQAFTNEQGQAGVTLQHSWEPGKVRRDDDDTTAKLLDIDLRMPNHLPRKKLLRVIEKAIGEQVDEGADFDVEIDLGEALQRLGYSAAETEVQLQHQGTEGVDVIVKIAPGVRSEVLFSGLEPPRDQRSSITRLYRPNLVGVSPLDDMLERTRQVLLAQGYEDPTIEVSLDTTTGDDGRPLELITIHSQSDRRLALGTPIFQGCSPEVAELLQQSFPSKLQRMELVLATEAAQQQVVSGLRGLGFVEPRWLASHYDSARKAPVVELSTGPRRRIASLDIQGTQADIALFDELDLRDRLHADAPLRLDLLSQAALALESHLRNDGYNDARVTPSVTDRPDEPLAFDVIIEVDRGPAHELREAEVTGQQHTRENWLRRIADLPQEGPLRERDISLARRRLLATGIVRRAQLLRQPSEVPEGAEVRPTDVVIDIQEHPKFRISTGVRWESSVGASAVFDVVDRSFTSRGATLGFRALVGEENRSFRIYTAIPRVAASHNNLELFVEQRWNENFNIDRQRLEGSFQLSRQLGEQHLLRFYGSYREGTGLQTANPGGPLESFRNPFLGVQWVYGEQHPDKLFPDGTFASVDLTGSSEGFGTDQDFLRLFSTWQSFFPIGNSRWLWGQSVRFGWADAFGEPLLDDLRFRSGGEYSVRGYSTDSLGPRVAVDETLVPLGGEALLVLNQELRFPVWDQLAGVVFLDIGNVWDDKDDFGRDLANALGAGLRYDSPVGPLRFDIAFPIDRREDDSEIKLYFGFGNIF